MKPLIGIMMRCEDNEEKTSIQYVLEFVRTTIIKAQAEPFFLTPPQNIDYYKTKYADYPALTEEEEKQINFWLDSINGLFIPGGIKFTEYDRYVLKQAIKKEIPVLSVCLGMQLMSCHEQEVKLYDVAPSNINHNVDLKQKYAHKVKLDKTSRLYEIVGEEEIMVNSFHKKRVGENSIYRVVARSEDGIIEALEYPGEVFHIGLQWHPEKIYDEDIYAKKIIDAFILESSRRKTKLTTLREAYFKENFVSCSIDRKEN